MHQLEGGGGDVSSQVVIGAICQIVLSKAVSRRLVSSVIFDAGPPFAI